MQRFFIHLAYNGKPYCGWQIQPDAPTVQAALENALQALLGKPVSVVGCGRTDTGVHASNYFAHFDWEEEPFSPEARASWVYRLNALLDKEISIYRIFEVPADLHARLSATSRTYYYYLHRAKNPFLEDCSYYCRKPFDEEKIQQAAAKLCSYSDFTSFSKLHTQTKTNICNLTRAEFEYLGDDRYRFVFTANRFLRNMVRAMVGTLLDIGFGKYTIDTLDEIVAAKDRCRAGNSVPPQGLFLQSITYF